MVEPKLKACSARVCDYPCLPLDRGLTVAIVPETEWVPTGTYRNRTPVCDPRPASVLRVTHHSGLGVRGHAGLDWPASVAGLASAKRAMASLLAEPIDWTAGADALAERCASAGQSAECVAAIVRAEQDAFVSAGGRLLRTAPLVAEPLPSDAAPIELPATRAECVAELLACVAAYHRERARVEALPDYRHAFGTWSKGVRMGEIRWPPRYAHAERQAKQAEQAAADQARAEHHVLRVRITRLSEQVVDAPLGSIVPCADAKDNAKRRAAIESARELLRSLESALLSTRVALGHPRGTIYARALSREIERIEQAQALHTDVDAHGFGPGTRCNVAPSRYPYPGEEAPANPVAVLTVAFDSIDGHALREIVDAHGREWTVPRERLQPTKEQP